MTLYETYRSWSDIVPPNALPTFLQNGGTIEVSGGLSLQTKVGSLSGAICATRISYGKAAPLIGQIILALGQRPLSIRSTRSPSLTVHYPLAASSITIALPKSKSSPRRRGTNQSATGMKSISNS